MRLFLAVAVLVLAFVAYTEAQEGTIEQQFNKLGQQITEAGKNIAEKLKGGIEDLNNSEFVTSGRTWMNDLIQKMKDSITDNTQ